MKDGRKAIEPRTYLRRYIFDYLLSNVIAYVVVLIFIAAVSGYSPAELERAFVRSRILMVALLSVMSVILFRILSPLKRAMLLVESGVEVPEDLLRRAVRIFKNYRYYALAINIVCYPLTIFLSIMLTYRTLGFVQPQQWWILLNGSLVVFAVTMFQQTLFNIRSIAVKEYLRLHSFAGVRSASLAAAVAGTVFFFMLSYAATAYNNNVRTIRFFGEHELEAVTKVAASSSAEERSALLALVRAEGEAFALRQNLMTLGYSLGMLLICTLGVSLFAREVRSHVGVSRRKLAEITSEGCDLSQKVVITTFNDIGLLNQDVNNLIDRNREMFTRIADAARHVGEAAASLGGLADSLVEHSRSMQERSTRMSDESAGMDAKMTSLSSSASELDGSIASVTSAAGQLDVSIGRISSDARSARSSSEQSVTVIRDTRAHIAGLGQKANEIGKIIDSITAIGQRTTILSLNAAVEAAHAGAAGRGFAVVAGEVKQLAQQVNAAAERVREQVQAIQESTGAAVLRMEEITNSAESVKGVVTSIASSVDDQSRATGDISRHMTSAAGEIRQIAEHIGKSADTVRSVTETAAGVLETGRSVSDAGARIRTSADELAKVSKRLEAEVGKFRL